MDETVKCMVAFAQKCLLSDCGLVSFATRYAIWVKRMSSPLGANVYHCVTGCVGRILTVFCTGCRWPVFLVLHIPYPLVMWVELLLLRSGVLTFSSSGLVWRRLTVWLRMLHAISFLFSSLIYTVCT